MPGARDSFSLGATGSGYLLIDVLRCPLPENPDNLVARLFELERCRSLEDIDRQVARLAQLLTGPENLELRRSFTTFLRGSLLPARFPGAEILAMLDLEEVRPMLRETVKEWTQQWMSEGMAEGRKVGRQEGRKLGRKEGLRLGRREGEADLLIRLLERRFGPLNPQERARIDAADAERLLEWGERLLTAGSVSEVFGD